MPRRSAADGEASFISCQGQAEFPRFSPGRRAIIRYNRSGRPLTTGTCGTAVKPRTDGASGSLGPSVAPALCASVGLTGAGGTFLIVAISGAPGTFVTCGPKEGIFSLAARLPWASVPAPSEAYQTSSRVL